MLLRSVVWPFSVFATAEVATREANANIAMMVFMEVSSQAYPPWCRSDCWLAIGALGATPGWSAVFAITVTVRPSSDSPPPVHSAALCDGAPR